MNTMKNVDVLVVGAGGCGLALSVMLADKGVDFLTVDRDETTSDLPKAHYLNQRTMEILRQHGMADEVFARGTPPHYRSRLKWYTSFAGDGDLDNKTIFEFGGLSGVGSELEAMYAANSAVSASNLPQIRLEPLIRRHADERAPGRVLFQHELVALSQDDAGCTARIRKTDNGEESDVRAKYVVGADGGRTVGRMLGVEMQGQRKMMNVVSVHFEADLSQYLPDDRVLINWLRNPYRPVFAGLVPMGPDRWGRHSKEWSWGTARMPGDPTEFDEEVVLPLMRLTLGIPDLQPKVRKISEWSVEAVLADRYQVGRVFLAGDAAHRHPPTTGLGLNTGIQDAHNIAWKLAAVTSGRAAPALLASYEAERRPIGAFNVNWALNAWFNHMAIEAGIIMTHPDNLADMQTPEHVQAAFRSLLADTPDGLARRARLSKIFATQTIEFCVQDVELGFRYDDGALVGDGSLPPPRDPLGSTYVPCTRPGHRLPHCWLDQGGKQVSTMDLVDDTGYTLLVHANQHGQSWADAARRVAADTGHGVKVVRIGRGGDALDAESRWRGLSQLRAGGAVLVRPDHIVAWRSLDAHPQPEGALAEALARISGRPTA